MTSAIAVGQIAQIRMYFRLLKQENGSYTFRQSLKEICVLHSGKSLVREASVHLENCILTNDVGDRSVPCCWISGEAAQGKKLRYKIL